MKLGLQLGYWGQLPSPDWVDRAVAAEELGFDSVWTAEAWGSDALHAARLDGRADTSASSSAPSVVQLVGAHTGRHGHGRDRRSTTLSDGRFQPRSRRRPARRSSRAGTAPVDKPLARTREYVEIIRKVMAARGAAQLPGRVLPAPVLGSGQRRARQAAQVDRAPAAAPHPDLPRRRGTEERQRRPPRSPTAGCRSTTRRTARTCTPISSPARRTTSRSPRCRAFIVTEDDRPETIEAALGGTRAMLALLHRRHGRQGPELPHQAGGQDGARRAGREDPGPVLRGQG